MGTSVEINGQAAAPPSEKKLEEDDEILSPPSEGKREIKDKLSLILELLWVHILTLPIVLLALLRKIFPPEEKSLKGKVALVTGAGRGLGKGLAVALAQEGCKVAVVDVNLANAEETASEICRGGGEAKAYKTNVAKVQEIRELRASVTKELGPVEFLVNNAGLIYAEPIEQCTEQAVSGVINVNVLSHFWMAREFLPSMRERNSGHIVAMSSASAFVPLVNASAYVTSKSGLKGFMECLRAELEAKPGNRIRTTTVFPYFVNTSAHYTEHWDLRIPPISIRAVTKATIEGIKRNSLIVTIPWMLYYLVQLRGFFPQKIFDKFSEVLYARVILASKDELERLPQTAILRDLAKGDSSQSL